MAEYEPLKSFDASMANSTAESNESRVLSDDDLIEVEDFASFKCYTPKEMESLNVTFNQSQSVYKLDADVEAHFYASTSLYQMKPEDVVGICPMRKSVPFISKPISECITESNPQAIADEFFGENDIVAKKATFKIPTLSMELAAEIYFQFCYLNANNDVIGVSTPFRFHNENAASPGQESVTTSIEESHNASNLENMTENYDSMVMEKRDDDDFIVVRSQESFLKERVEHLTKSNTLLEYLIRSLEKDLSNKTVELQKISNKLDGEKANYVKTEEDKNKALDDLENMARQNHELQQTLSELKQLLETEQSAKSQLQSELDLSKQKVLKLEGTFQNLQIGEVELKNILVDKEEEICVYKDMVANLKQINEELDKKLVTAEDKMLNLQSSLAKALNDCRSLQHDKERYNNYEMVLAENMTLRQRVKDLELVKAKQNSEIKTLEDELRNSVANFNNLDTKFQSEREANATKEQKNALVVDKTKFELIEMHARLEQSRVEYANLYRKYRSLQKMDRSKLEKAASSASRSNSIASIASVSTACSSKVVPAPEPVSEKIDDIDLRLQQLEKEEEAQKLVEPVAIATTQQHQGLGLISAAPKESLLIDIESEQNQDILSTTSSVSETPVEANTSPKMIASPSAPPAVPNTMVPIPCIMCEKVIECRQHEDGSGQMHEMVNHLEAEHKQKMCPVCSTLFDTRLPIFNTYFANHIQNHFNNIKYPNLNQN